MGTHRCTCSRHPNVWCCRYTELTVIYTLLCAAGVTEPLALEVATCDAVLQPLRPCRVSLILRPWWLGVRVGAHDALLRKVCDRCLQCDHLVKAWLIVGFVRRSEERRVG